MPALQALGQQQQALAVEPQHLEHVAAATSEAEDVAVERVLGERGLHYRGQAVEALSHVRVAGLRAGRSCEGVQRLQHAAQVVVVDHTVEAHAGSTDFDLDGAHRRTRRR